MKYMTILAALLLTLSSTAQAQSKTIDVEKSVLIWNGKKVTGEHTGNIMFKSGLLKFDGDILKGGEFVVDMNSLTCTDLKDQEYNNKLVGHLKSDDFFGVTKYPVSQLALTSVKMTDGKYWVKGNLTIKDKTNPIEFEVKKEADSFKGTMVINRAKYNVRYGSGTFFDNLGDKMIYDDFELEFQVFLE